MKAPKVESPINNPKLISPKSRERRSSKSSQSNATHITVSPLPSPTCKSGGAKGRWTLREHEAFLDGYKKFGKDWKKIQPLVKTRTVIQIRSHAQKLFNRDSYQATKRGRYASRLKGLNDSDCESTSDENEGHYSNNIEVNLNISGERPENQSDLELSVEQQIHTNLQLLRTAPSFILPKKKDHEKRDAATTIKQELSNISSTVDQLVDTAQYLNINNQFSLDSNRLDIPSKTTPLSDSSLLDQELSLLWDQSNQDFEMTGLKNSEMNELDNPLDITVLDGINLLDAPMSKTQPSIYGPSIFSNVVPDLIEFSPEMEASVSSQVDLDLLLQEEDNLLLMDNLLL